MRPPVFASFLLASLVLSLVACSSALPASPSPTSVSATTGALPSSNRLSSVLATETFLADIAQRVAGDRVRVEALLPIGVDPHGFEPAPSDVVKITKSDVLIVNGAGLEEFLGKVLSNAGGQRTVVEASAGLPSRVPREGEALATPAASDQPPPGDPHYWLDPNLVVKYVENIRDGLTKADPDGASTYAANASAYITQLEGLDRWIAEQVKQLAPGQRQLVTNHESLGYFADRYGFKIVGTVIPNVTTETSPSAQQMASLVNRMKATGVKAIFLETGSNTQLAEQIANEAGVKVVTQVYTHSITDANGPAPSYVEMMRYNTKVIVDALK